MTDMVEVIQRTERSTTARALPTRSAQRPAHNAKILTAGLSTSLVLGIVAYLGNSAAQAAQTTVTAVPVTVVPVTVVPVTVVPVTVVTTPFIPAVVGPATPGVPSSPQVIVVPVPVPVPVPVAAPPAAAPPAVTSGTTSASR